MPCESLAVLAKWMADDDPWWCCLPAALWVKQSREGSTGSRGGGVCVAGTCRTALQRPLDVGLMPDHVCRCVVLGRPPTVDERWTKNMDSASTMWSRVSLKSLPCSPVSRAESETVQCGHHVGSLHGVNGCHSARFILSSQRHLPSGHRLNTTST